MSITIYHNPRCSKSRKTLEILENAGVKPTIVEYLKTPPSAALTQQLAASLGIAVREMLRLGEAEFKEAADLPDLEDGAALAAWLEGHPKVIERPIVVDESSGKAVIGRPPEAALRLLNQ